MSFFPILKCECRKQASYFKLNFLSIIIELDHAKTNQTKNATMNLEKTTENTMKIPKVHCARTKSVEWRWEREANEENQLLPQYFHFDRKQKQKLNEYEIKAIGSTKSLFS